MWANSLSLVVLWAVLAVFKVKRGTAQDSSGPPVKDFHTFKEVLVHLKDPQWASPVHLTEKGDGHHFGSLNLEIHDRETPNENPVFEVDLTLNRELIPQNYFQKYHQKVSPLKKTIFEIISN